MVLYVVRCSVEFLPDEMIGAENPVSHMLEFNGSVTLRESAVDMGSRATSCRRFRHHSARMHRM
jgi:hypothetical protein